MRSVLRLALRLLARDYRAGELRVMAVSVVIAVAAFTTVAFFADRVKQALSQEASQLLGADLVLVSDRPIGDPFREAAASRSLRRAETIRFPSMAMAGERSLLVEVKSIGSGYPLKGRLEIRDASGAIKPGAGGPSPGTVWLDDRAMARLGIAFGGTLDLGDRSFTVAGRIESDPEANIGFLNMMPRLIVAFGDLEATGLVQTGSRIKYRLMLGGSASQLESWRKEVWDSLQAGQRIEDVRDARPEIRSALERAEKFLGLASLLSIVLAAVAVALAARRYAQRHLDHCAMLRCLGASRRATVWIHAIQVAIVGLAGGLAGCALGFIAQFALSEMLAPIVTVQLPPPSALPALQGVAAGLVMLTGFALPPLIDLGRVPALRVLRRDLGPPGGLAWLAYAAGLAAVAALVFWHTQDAKLASWVLGGLIGAAAVAAVAAFGLIRATAGLARKTGFVWRFGLANLSRRASGTVVQIVALGAGLLALILLSITRGDLLDSWRKSLPDQAPNRFLVNIQPEQVSEIERFFAEERLASPEFFPMIRGRLTEINGKAVSSANYTEDRARRLVDREFNLSWAARPQDDNRIVAGRWWRPAGGEPQFSVEKGIADTLGIRAGDTLTYQIAGQRLEAPVTSLRTVAWDSFRVNFFVVSPPGTLESYPASYVTSFHLPESSGAVMDRLVKRFPNLLVIDVAAILQQVQTMMGQVVRAVEFLFLFSLAAGFLVLFAAIQTTHDERRREAAILRTLGASTRQIGRAQTAEFMVIGALSGVFAAVGATSLGFVLASRVLEVAYEVNPLVWVAGLGLGALGVALAGLLGTRGVLRTAPMEVLRRS
ncbi:MAG: FtsX-like permease family protein [Betaproteobacteria bacterium]|nr:FtsX-like permease family protein [Betaproteobacteria bacterium]